MATKTKGKRKNVILEPEDHSFVKIQAAIRGVPIGKYLTNLVREDAKKK